MSSTSFKKASSFNYKKNFKDNYSKEFSKATSLRNSLSSKNSSTLTRANYFLKSTLKDYSTISTFKVGKEVYNLRDKETNKVIGYLGFLLSKEKLNSLSSFIINLASKYSNNNFIVIINYTLENKFYYLTSINNTIIEGE